jgi:hypothetical protein
MSGTLHSPRLIPGGSPCARASCHTTERWPRRSRHSGAAPATRGVRSIRRTPTAVGEAAFTQSPAPSRRNTGSPKYPSSTTTWPGLSVRLSVRSLWKICAEYALVSGRRDRRLVFDRDGARAQMCPGRRRGSKQYCSDNGHGAMPHERAATHADHSPRHPRPASQYAAPTLGPQVLFYGPRIALR